MAIVITYDPGARAAYIRLTEIAPGAIRKTEQAVPDQILLDFDRQNHLVGIEILNADYVLPKEVLKSAEKPSIS